jgi:hypothetical protein
MNDTCGGTIATSKKSNMAFNGEYNLFGVARYVSLSHFRFSNVRGYAWEKEM